MGFPILVKRHLYIESGHWQWLPCDMKGYIYSSCYYHQIGSIHLSHCYHIFPWLCAWDICFIIFCHLLHIHSGKTGNLFSLLLCSLWWVEIVGYVLPCRSYWFVGTVHHLIIIIVQTYLKTLNLWKCLSDILSSVWVRLSILYNMWGCVFSVYPFPLWWLREYIYFVLLSSSNWKYEHCLGLGHETMVCAVCVSMF